MQENGRNIYKRAREAAGLTQEKAAEILNLGVRTLADYEIGQRRPPAQTVDQMATAYRSPGLRLEHVRDTDELGVIPQRASPQPLPLAVLQLVNRVQRFAAGVDRRLMSIAEDGVIDEQEQEDFAAILEDIGGIVGAGMQVGVCVPRAKKDRPDVGASKRSRPQAVKHENDCEAIIPQPRENARGICAGKAVTWK